MEEWALLWFTSLFRLNHSSWNTSLFMLLVYYHLELSRDQYMWPQFSSKFYTLIEEYGDRYGDRSSSPWISRVYSPLPPEEVSIERREYLYLYIFLEAEGGKKLLKQIHRVFFLHELESLHIECKSSSTCIWRRIVKISPHTDLIIGEW